jgi:hypothetical protein
MVDREFVSTNHRSSTTDHAAAKKKAEQAKAK